MTSKPGASKLIIAPVMQKPSERTAMQCLVFYTTALQQQGSNHRIMFLSSDTPHLSVNWESHRGNCPSHWHSKRWWYAATSDNRTKIYFEMRPRGGKKNKKNQRGLLLKSEQHRCCHRCSYGHPASHSGPWLSRMHPWIVMMVLRKVFFFFFDPSRPLLLL